MKLPVAEAAARRAEFRQLQRQRAEQAAPVEPEVQPAAATTPEPEQAHAGSSFVEWLCGREGKMAHVTKDQSRTLCGIKVAGSWGIAPVEKPRCPICEGGAK